MSGETSARAPRPGSGAGAPGPREDAGRADLHRRQGVNQAPSRVCAAPLAITLRRADPADVPAIEALAAAAYGHYVARIGRKPGPMLDDYAARVAAGEASVALGPAGAIVGLLVLEMRDGTPPLLDNVAVAPHAQGQGVGRALIAHAETAARRHGAASLRLYTHEKMTENIALYRRLGFAEIARIEEKGFRRVYMEKTLA